MEASNFEYQLGFLAKVFAKNARYKALLAGDNSLLIMTERGSKEIPYASMMGEVAIQRGVLWDSLHFPLSGGRSFLLGGIARNQSVLIRWNLHLRYEKFVCKAIENISPAIENAYHQAVARFSGLQYIRQGVARKWAQDFASISSTTSLRLFRQHAPAQVHQWVDHIKPFLEHCDLAVKQLNDAYILSQLTFYKEYFDRVEGKPLTLSQRQACIVNERNNLILAGAGTGKTSTMIGRAGYLLHSGQATAREILMLAFAKKAAEEMDERAHVCLGANELTTKTFHALGKQIIAKVEGRVPDLHPMAEDDALKTKFVDDQIQSLLLDEAYRSKLLTYFTQFLHPYKNRFSFKTEGDYHRYILDNEIRTLQGEQVKSYEECEIANYLYRQGVRYEYEAPYRINTSGPDFKPYRPDFYLPDYDIYIEHFAVDENQQTPAFINRQKYLEGMAWKRNLHAQHQTRLIETYSYQKRQGTLIPLLEDQLIKAGVNFAPTPDSLLLDKLKSLGLVTKFSALIASVLALFKAAGISIQHYAEQARLHEDQERMRAAVELFEPIYDAYEKALRDAGCIDFDDMLLRSIAYVERGRYQSPYLHIMVDEFQDISATRARLVKALLAQHPEGSLFCVGDDWQSIYRFTGSDVSITKNFEQHFGDTAMHVLDMTFRFNNKVGEVASQFIGKNPDQIEKNIRSFTQVEQASIALLKTSQPDIAIEAALSDITLKSPGKATVLILARYRFLRPNLSGFKPKFPRLDIQFMSIHESKGKEADYVIVIGLEQGANGFPSEKISHPLIELLLPKTENYAYAEERRLFYVALTRARHYVYLVTDGDKASCFARELVKERYDIAQNPFLGEGFQTELADVPCEKCKSGFLVHKSSQSKVFYACNQYPLCTHTQAGCPRCGNALVLRDRFRICKSEGCKYREPVCPACAGSLILRNGPHGKFWGCSNYRKDSSFSCGHKEKWIDGVFD